MIDYFRKLKINHNSFQIINDNKIKINNVIDTLTNEEKEIVVNQIKVNVNRLNPERISITNLEKTISAYLFLVQFELPVKSMNHIKFLVNRGVLWELFGYKYKYKIQMLKLGIQLSNLNIN